MMLAPSARTVSRTRAIVLELSMFAEKENEKEKELQRKIKDQQERRTSGPLPVGQDESVRNELLREVLDAVKLSKMMRTSGSRENGHKHGGYSEKIILPGENAEAFRSLHQELLAEFKPRGRSEKEAVLSLAQHYWQKRRLNRYFYDEATWLSEHGAYDEIDSADWYFLLLYQTTSLNFAHAIIRKLPDRYLPFMLPELEKREHADDEKEIQRLKELLIECVALDERRLNLAKDTVQFKAETALFMRQLIEKKMAIEERLDSRIDRTIKQIAQLQTFKQVILTQAPTAKTKVSALPPANGSAT
jgi:hypothetical protein